MLNVLQQPWTLIAISIAIYFVLQAIRQCETNWWISSLLIILFVLSLTLNRFYTTISPKNRFVIPLALIILLIYETSLVVRAILADKKLWWLWIAPAFIAVAGTGLDVLIKTDIELIRNVIYTGASAIEREDASKVEPLIADDYSDSFHRSKESLMARMKSMLSQPFVEKITPRIASITVESPTAKVNCTSQISFDSSSYVSQYYMKEMLVTTDIELQKQSNDHWLINRIEIVKINLQPANWSDTR
ncbi:MAG: hypothetical protein ACYTE8_03225 [Planctomycetota bacterium]|jgi:hypothetical protein